ncbi:MAG: sigma-54-dependent Fis family transcriptional regulator [Piscirickettsiaceae bacterium]|nr:MAG: sigma-54-dependent Fis family transcriptional regulator [Piscirickettsiaceae bacterium]
MNGTSTIVIAGLGSKEAVLLSRCLHQHYSVYVATNAVDVVELLDKHPVDLLLCQHVEHSFDAINILYKARTSHPEVIRLIAGDLNKENKQKAVNEAAVYQFISNDWTVIQVELLVNRALENKELSYRHRHLSRELKMTEKALIRHQHKELIDVKSTRFEQLIFSSPNMATLCNLAKKAAATELPILIQGETGTGKELMARGIHFNSKRNDRPLLVHNCGGMSDDLLHSELFGHKRGAFTGAISDRMGLFPAADGGTVFLDEISDVSPTFQVSLLRFLQEGEVKPLGSDQIIKCDVRIIAACNQPLDVLISKGKFRQDLFYRLNGFQLNIPPLRKRTSDIEVLTNFLAQKFSAEFNRSIRGISPDLIDKFTLYSWPGNVRELENEIKRMIAMTDNGNFLTEEHLSPHIASLKPTVKSKNPLIELNGQTLKDKVAELEELLIREALGRLRWNQSKTAAELGLSRVGLSNKIKRYSIGDNSPVA